MPVHRHRQVALREVLAEGRVVLRPDAANARFEGSLVLSHEEFIEQKQIDIKLVAGAGYGLFLAFRSRRASSSSVPTSQRMSRDSAITQLAVIGEAFICSYVQLCRLGLQIVKRAKPVHERSG
jgi:hypothetical protein